MYGSVVIYRLLYQIVERYQNVTVVIHLLCDPVKLLDGGHPFTEALCLFVILEKCFLRIDNQRMIKDMRHLIDIHPHAGIFCRRVF